jgi:hypothetical protein
VTDRRRLLAPALAVALVWVTALYLVPLAVGIGVGAIPVRLVSSGILFDHTAVSFAGFMGIVWGPVIAGLLFAALAMRLAATPFRTSLGIIGATLAATLMVAGGALGVGPGSTLLLGTELRWVWRLSIGLAGMAVGLAVPMLLKAHAEGHSLDLATIKKGMVLGGLVVAVLMFAFGPGPILGRAITAGGSWLGSLAWILAL